MFGIGLFLRFLKDERGADLKKDGERHLVWYLRVHVRVLSVEPHVRARTSVVISDRLANIGE
jgi:hypothetical protein